MKVRITLEFDGTLKQFQSKKGGRELGKLHGEGFAVGQPPAGADPKVRLVAVDVLKSPRAPKA